MSDTLLLEVDGRVASLTFNRPELLNATDAALAERFEGAVARVLGDPAVRVLVMAGAGRAFMAGGDLAAFHAAPPAARAELASRTIAPYHRALIALAQSDVLSVASVHGAVAGAGLSLCLGADFAVAAEGTRFSFAYTRVAGGPDCGGSYFLPRLVGLRKALEIALLSETFEAARALEVGLVNRVVPEAERAAVTRELAVRLGSGPRASFGSTKRLLRESLGRSFAEQLEAERENFAALAVGADFQEGLDAFREKRPPRFTA